MTKNKVTIYLLSSLFVSVAILLLVGVFIILGDIKKSSSQLNTLEQKLSWLKMQTSNIEDFQTNYLAYQKNLEEMDSLLKQGLFIDPEIPVDFIKFLKQEADVEAVAIQTSPLYLSKSKDDLWNFVAFNIDLKGEYPDVARFTQRLENSQWLVKIVKLDITYNKKEKGVEANLKIKVYARK